MTSSLLISNLPTVLTEEESRDLLRHFGAEQVHIVKKCRRKKAIFARFRSVAAAQHTLRELHQAKLGGSRLIVEYADDDLPVKPISGSEQPAEQAARSVDRFASFPFPSPALRYAYPPPTAETLRRICAALGSSPKLYTQVLHLMNKLSLPAPFADASVASAAAAASVPPPITAPSIPAAAPAAAPPVASLRRDVAVQTEPTDSDSDSAESELGSDGESAVTRPAAKRRRLGRLPDGASLLRAARQQRRAAPAPAPAAPALPISEVFDAPVLTPLKRPVLKLPAERPAGPPANGAAPVTVEEGFAKLHPARTLPHGEQVPPEGDEESEFITNKQLAENRLSKEDMKSLPVCARYTPGDVSARLYIKNLDKRVVTADLKRIYGRYVDWTDDQQKNAFDIRLMQEGRMKGQAFVSLPSPAAAERALSDTHGFLLRDKPMVVQFGRSARPREDS